MIQSDKAAKIIEQKPTKYTALCTRLIFLTATLQIKILGTTVTCCNSHVLCDSYYWLPPSVMDELTVSDQPPPWHEGWGHAVLQLGYRG